ncbi:MAG: hypothetical protein PHZ09_04120 [Eubacteriales bacterium]|nr:hypothetical protein [Eubacteriales bacterium]
MAQQIIDKDKYLTYLGKPLVREKNAMCYGDMTDKYILFMIILSADMAEGTAYEAPSKILVQILSTDTTKPSHERVVKQFEKNNLYDAMDIGLIWLNKLNENDKT